MRLHAALDDVRAHAAFVGLKRQAVIDLVATAELLQL